MASPLRFKAFSARSTARRVWLWVKVEARSSQQASLSSQACNLKQRRAPCQSWKADNKWLGCLAYTYSIAFHVPFKDSLLKSPVFMMSHCPVCQMWPQLPILCIHVCDEWTRPLHSPSAVPALEPGVKFYPALGNTVEGWWVLSLHLRRHDTFWSEPLKIHFLWTKLCPLKIHMLKFKFPVPHGTGPWDTGFREETKL